MTTIDAFDLTSESDLEHLDDHIGAEVMDDQSVVTYSRSWQSALKVQQWLILEHGADTVVQTGKSVCSASFIKSGLSVQANADTVAEAICMAALVFIRKSSK